MFTSTFSQQRSQRAAADFSKSIRQSLQQRGFVIVSTMAIPAFEGDVYFSGTAYVMVDTKCDGEFRRTYDQVVALAKFGADVPAFASRIK